MLLCNVRGCLCLFYPLSAASLFRASEKNGDFLTHPQQTGGRQAASEPRLEMLGQTAFINSCHQDGPRRKPSVAEEENQT